MRVFVTGASGWIGSATVDELLAAGHQVVGLARSDRSASSLQDKGVEVRRGDLDDLESIRAGAEDAEAVIHLANKHDFDHPDASAKAERDAVQTISDTLAGSGKTFMLASGVAGLAQGRPSTEHDPSLAVGPDSPRGGTENLALEYVERDVRVVSLRFAPTVHGIGDHGFVARLAQVARERGVAAYVGDGSARWAAVHVGDAARMNVLALANAESGAKVHAVAEEGVASKEIAEALGRSLGVQTTSIDPDDALDHFGWIGRFFGMDLPATSAITREALGWSPTGPTLIEDIEAGGYPGN